MTWKNKYVFWYRILESIFGDDVPHFSDKEIEDCVSNKDWIIIPVAGERNRLDARLAQRPNIYFDLSNADEIIIGISYDKLESVNRLREIISHYNEKYRNAILNKLATLSDGFSTKLSRKIKKKYWGESPSYEKVYSEQSNKMDLPKFFKLFEAVDNIMDERDLLGKGQKYRLAPAIDLIDTHIRRDEITFRKTLLQMKPIYEIAINVKTEEEFQEGRLQDHLRAKKKKQEDFAKYVEDLKDKLNKGMITSKEYREKIMNFQKSN